MRDAHEQVRTATKSVARTQKTYFDKYVKGPPFHVGQSVWLYWPLPKLRQRHRKLTRLWTGPWQIMEFKTAIVVVIRHTLSHKRQTVHVDRLVPCNSSPPTPPSPSLNADTHSIHNTPDMQQQHQTSPTPVTTKSTTRRSTRTRNTPSYLDSYLV